ncbi:DNA-binding domain-containing protein [Microbulbifer mangrovi]|uniref:HvfC family RiPP maturation protein n=1 Tax=Microbulbifer mangrovi TaxID=927787 RepID=UPI000990653F|nr:putative DNA-binding domain-containing protein [Microbulbifer mangrovi]
MGADTSTDNGTDTKGTFVALQRDFAAHLRAPDEAAAPSDIEDRRVGIYRDLIYNNIESFIAGGFPVLRSIIDDEPWHAMVRDFVQRHSAQSPYFLQISEEFLEYLQNERAVSAAAESDPPFMLELAHYEWVELALDVSDIALPDDLERNCSDEQVLDWAPVVSPLAWNLSYHYPVHHIGPAHQPVESPQTPTFLVVYRDRADNVAFLEANAVTAHLLTLIQDANPVADPSAASASSLPATASGRMVLQRLAEDLQHPQPDQLLAFGTDILKKLLGLDILAGFRPL